MLQHTHSLQPAGASVDALQRVWARLTNTAGCHRFAIAQITVGLATGGKHVATAEFPTPAPRTSGAELSRTLDAWEAGNNRLALAQDFSLVGLTVPSASQPAEGVLRTLITRPAGVVKIEINQFLNGVGSIDWGRSRVEKV